MPDRLLDLELWQYNAVILGHQDAVKEQMALSVYTGYYSGYYNSASKHKKTPTEIVRKMFKKRSARKEEVDVAAFEAIEQAFNAKMNRGGNTRE